MRRMEFITSSLLWLAAAILLPMAVLEPVQAAPGTGAATVAATR